MNGWAACRTLTCQTYFSTLAEDKQFVPETQTSVYARKYQRAHSLSFYGDPRPHFKVKVKVKCSGAHRTPAYP